MPLKDNPRFEGSQKMEKQGGDTSPVHLFLVHLFIHFDVQATKQRRVSVDAISTLIRMCLLGNHQKISTRLLCPESQ